MHAGGEHDDRQLAGTLIGTDLLGQCHTGLTGQHPVEDDQVGQRGADRRFGLFGAAGRTTTKPACLRLMVTSHQNRRFILDDQNRGVSPPLVVADVTSCPRRRRRTCSGDVLRVVADALDARAMEMISMEVVMVRGSSIMWVISWRMMDLNSYRRHYRSE